MSPVGPVGGPILPLPAQATARSVSAKAAPSTAALWNVLTDEEKSYFEVSASLGPVSYSAGGELGQNGPAPIGQRLDVTG